MSSNIIRSPLIAKFQKNLTSKFLLTRHGESFYQKKHREIYHIKNKNAQEYSRQIKEIRYDPDLCDCEITENGKNESYYAGKRLNELNIKYVFCSPLTRALQSCQYILKGYTDNNTNEKINKKPKVIVHPLIFEKIETNSDIISNIYRSMSAFPEFDWSEFSKLNQETLPIYMLKYCDTIINMKTNTIKFSNDNPYFNLCFNHYKKNLEFKHQEILLKAMEELNEQNSFIESSIKTYDRLLEFKTFVKNFLKENNLKNDERILMVGHSILFKHLATNLIYEDTFDPVEIDENYIHLDNAQMASLYFDDEILFRNLRV